MNKVVTCNIAGLIFNIEENAYETLSRYLKSVKSSIARSEGADEIYADIEHRIAELFNERMSSRREVVLDTDVAAIQKALGQPEDFVIDDEANSTQSEQTFAGQNFEKSEKRLMRDSSNAAIGGVCSGIAAYLNWDVVLVRIIFLVAFFVTGIGFLAYIIIWIVTPEANSAADRLKMQGKPVNVDTITKEVEMAAARLEKYAYGVQKSQKYKELKQSGQKFGKGFVRVFGGLLAAGTFIGIIAFLFFNLTENGIFVDNDGENFVSLFDMSKIVFASPTQSLLGWTGLLLTVLLPLIYLVIFGTVLMLDLSRKYLGKILLAFFMLWIVGIAFFSIVSVQIGRDFTFHEYTENHNHSVFTNSLIVEVPESFKTNDIDDDLLHTVISDDQVKTSFVRLQITESKDSLFHISTKKYASGITRKKAYKRIENISHQINRLDSNRIVIENFYQYPASDRLRRQKVIVQIEVPKNAEIDWCGEVKKSYFIIDKRGSHQNSSLDD
jgi:phage shock protein C